MVGAWRSTDRGAMSRSKPSPWVITGLLAVVGALNYADRSAFAAVIPPLRSELKLSDAVVGGVMSLFLWSYGAGSPIAGRLADRFSRSLLVVISVVLWSSCMGLTGFAAGLFTLCACRIGLGLGESPFHPAAFALVADHHVPVKRARAMSVLSIGFQLGTMVGGTAAGFIAQRFGWRASFWALGLAGIALAVVCRFVITDGPKKTPAATAASATGPTFLYLLRNPSYHLIVGKQILAEASTWIFIFWLPLYFFENFHLKLGAAGFFATLIVAVPMSAGIIGGGFVSDAVAKLNGKYRMLAFGGCYVAAAPLLVAFYGHLSFTGVTVVVVCWSFLRGAGTSNERPSTCEVVPSAYRATAFGILNLFATLSGAAGSLVTGILKENFGLNAIFGASSVLFLLTGASMIIGTFLCMPRDMARAQALESAHL
jgi:predicted MFS family arabinose efflux permease